MTKINRNKLENIKFSLNLYASSGRERQKEKENKPSNSRSIFSDEFDMNYQKYTDKRNYKQSSFRIDSQKSSIFTQLGDSRSILVLRENDPQLRNNIEGKISPTSPVLNKQKVIGKTNSQITSHQSGTASGRSMIKKKSIFTIRPRHELPFSTNTAYSNNVSPHINSNKQYQTETKSVTPGSVTRKRFFINPNPGRARVLDF